jgi:hypothetical protein
MTSPWARPMCAVSHTFIKGAWNKCCVSMATGSYFDGWNSVRTGCRDLHRVVQTDFGAHQNLPVLWIHGVLVLEVTRPKCEAHHYLHKLRRGNCIKFNLYALYSFAFIQNVTRNQFAKFELIMFLNVRALRGYLKACSLPWKYKHF